MFEQMGFLGTQTRSNAPESKETPETERQGESQTVFNERVTI